MLSIVDFVCESDLLKFVDVVYVFGFSIGVDEVVECGFEFFFVRIVGYVFEVWVILVDFISFGVESILLVSFFF